MDKRNNVISFAAETITEEVACNQRLTFSMRLSSFYLNQFGRDLSNNPPFASLPDLLCRYCEEFAEDLIDTELRWLGGIKDTMDRQRLPDSPKKQAILDCIGEYEVIRSKSPNLRLGWGTGLDGKTILRLLDDALRRDLRDTEGMFNTPRGYAYDPSLPMFYFPKSKRFTVRNDQPHQSLGWCRIEPVNP